MTSNESTSNRIVEINVEPVELCKILKFENMVQSGGEVLSDTDKQFSKFVDEYENKFLAQGEYKNRTIEETLNLVGSF